MHSLLEEIPRVVEAAFSPRQAEADKRKQELIALDPESAERAKGFWFRLALAFVALGSGAFIWTRYHVPIEHLLAKLGPSRSGADEFVDQVKRETASRPKFNPVMDTQYKSTYVDNVLYTKRYLEVKQNEEIHKRWVLSSINFS